MKVVGHIEFHREEEKVFYSEIHTRVQLYNENVFSAAWQFPTEQERDEFESNAIAWAESGIKFYDLIVRLALLHGEPDWARRDYRMNWTKCTADFVYVIFLNDFFDDAYAKAD